MIREPLAGLLMSWIRGVPSLSGSGVVEHQISLCHHCDVVHVAEVLLLSVEVDQFSGPAAA